MFRLFAIVVLILSLSHAEAQQEKSLCVDVFRHHPGMIDTKERMKAREQDEKLIVKTVETQIGSYSYGGNLGSGNVMAIPKEKLTEWKQEIDKLHKAGTLKYYDRWGPDKFGFGLIPLPNK